MQKVISLMVMAILLTGCLNVFALNDITTENGLPAYPILRTANPNDYKWGCGYNG